jgi:hypothetical protein
MGWWTGSREQSVVDVKQSTEGRVAASLCARNCCDGSKSNEPANSAARPLCIVLVLSASVDRAER